MKWNLPSFSGAGAPRRLAAVVTALAMVLAVAPVALTVSAPTALANEESSSELDGAAAEETESEETESEETESEGSDFGAQSVVEEPEPQGTWAEVSASAITFGDRLSSSRITATKDAPSGTYAWKDGTQQPQAGVRLYEVVRTYTVTTGSGKDKVTQTLTENGNVSVSVAKATPVLRAQDWPSASSITLGEPLSASTLTPASNDLGTFAWTNPATIPSGSGSQSVTFTPSDSANYSSLAGTVSVTVSTPEYSVTFNYNYPQGASGQPAASSNTRRAGQSWVTPADPRVDGFIFEGWFDAPSGGSKVTDWSARANLNQVHAQYRVDRSGLRLSGRVEICHATSSRTNPYVKQAPATVGVLEGHFSHQDDEDIIPPFTIMDGDNIVYEFEGKNYWGDGVAPSSTPVPGGSADTNDGVIYRLGYDCGNPEEAAELSIDIVTYTENLWPDSIPGSFGVTVRNSGKVNLRNITVSSTVQGCGIAEGEKIDFLPAGSSRFYRCDTPFLPVSDVNNIVEAEGEFSDFNGRTSETKDVKSNRSNALVKIVGRPGPTPEPTVEPTPTPSPTPSPTSNANAGSSVTNQNQPTNLNVMQMLPPLPLDDDWDFRSAELFEPGSGVGAVMREVQRPDGSLRQVMTLTVPEGVWTLDSETMVATFTPKRGFVGTVKSNFQMRSRSGISAAMEFVVTVRPVKAKKTTVTVYFDSMSPDVDKKAQAVIREKVAAVRKRGSILGATVVGFVQPTPNRGNDSSLSRSRAVNVASLLEAAKVKNVKRTTGLGRADITGAKARKATATIWYRPKSQ